MVELGSARQYAPKKIGIEQNRVIFVCFTAVSKSTERWCVTWRACFYTAGRLPSSQIYSRVGNLPSVINKGQDNIFSDFSISGFLSRLVLQLNLCASVAMASKCMKVPGNQLAKPITVYKGVLSLLQSQRGLHRPARRHCSPALAASREGNLPAFSRDWLTDSSVISLHVNDLNRVGPE